MKNRKNRSRSRGAERPDPSPRTIRQISAAIRENWSDRERAKRAGVKGSAWTPPRISNDEFPDTSLSGDHEKNGEY